MQVGVAQNMEGVGVGDVVHGIVAGVEFGFRRERMARAGAVSAVCMRRGIVLVGRLAVRRRRGRGLALRVWVSIVSAPVLGERKNAQTAKNQGNPILANGYCTHAGKTLVEIGGKSTLRFWF